mgnify:CR=1 FL=1
MAALLEDAVSCLARDPLRCSHRQRKSLEEAQQWVSAADSEDWIFSFSNVCETLGLDADSPTPRPQSLEYSKPE